MERVYIIATVTASMAFLGGFLLGVFIGMVFPSYAVYLDVCFSATVAAMATAQLVLLHKGRVESVT